MLLLLLSSAPHYVLHSFPTRRSSDLPPPAGTNPPGGGSAATGLRYVSLAVGDLAEVVAAVRQAGCEVPVEITPFGEGLAGACVCDPDGRWLEMLGPAVPACDRAAPAHGRARAPMRAASGSQHE